MGVVVFNGNSSEKYGIQVEHPPGYQTPARDYEMVHVPGRNGDILIDNGSYQNVSREYEIAVGSEGGDFAEMANRISEWLGTASGYARLEDSYEPEYYRMAACADGVTIENLEQHAGRATVAFNCKPQRFLKSGDKAVKFQPQKVKGVEVVFSSESYTQPSGDFVSIYYQDPADNLTVKVLGPFSGDIRGKTVFVPVEEKADGRGFWVHWIADGVVTNCYGFKIQQITLKEVASPVNAKEAQLPYLQAEQVEIACPLKLTDPRPESPDHWHYQATELLWRCNLKSQDTIGSVYNPTGFTALPAITAYGSGSGSLRVNGCCVDISDIRDSITIDSDIQDVYSGGANRVNRNQDIRLANGGFPKFEPGRNEVVGSGGITRLEVVPRWWTL